MKDKNSDLLKQNIYSLTDSNFDGVDRLNDTYF
jgi:hypothetical protein